MALVFEQFLTAEIGDATYLIGDDAAHTAAIVDPQVDVQRYIGALRKHGLALKYVIQTHIHEDFLSGARALHLAVPGSQLCLSGHDAPEYGFECCLIRDGDLLKVGKTVLTVKHTPGHTPEHVALLVSKAEEPPFAVLSGGSLLVGASGRTDLLGPERTEALTSKQYQTLHDFFLGLDDGVAVYPTHVHGSPCGAAIGDKISTTIGYERAHNPMLQTSNEQSFRIAALADLPPKPRYYPRLKDRNTSSPPMAAPPTSIRPLTAEEFRSAAKKGEARLLDTRHLLAFGGGHIPGALNIGAVGHAGIWAGWMLDADCPLLLVCDDDTRVHDVVIRLARTGFADFAGYLAGGMTAWSNAGFELQATQQLTVHDLAKELDASRVAVLDVRSPQEWRAGHVPGAKHIFLPELPDRLDEFDRAGSVAVYCDSGYRASIGASLFQAAGLKAANVAGGWQAWTAGGNVTERGL